MLVLENLQRKNNKRGPSSVTKTRSNSSQVGGQTMPKSLKVGSYSTWSVCTTFARWPTNLERSERGLNARGTRAIDLPHSVRYPDQRSVDNPVFHRARRRSLPVPFGATNLELVDINANQVHGPIRAAAATAVLTGQRLVCVRHRPAGRAPATTNKEQRTRLSYPRHKHTVC